MNRRIDKLFAANLGQLMEDEELTGMDVQQKTGVSARMVNYIRAGKSSPTLETIVRLASGLDVHPLELLLDDETRELITSSRKSS